MRDGTKKVREALTGVKAPGLSLPAISELIGGRASVKSMVKTGELVMAGEWRKHTYYLAAAGNGEIKTMKEVASKHVSPKPKNGGGLADLALENLIAASESLRAAVRNQVEGAEEDEVLSAALTQMERAERILAATRA